MAGPNPLQPKSFVAGGAITGKRIVKVGAADDAVLQATASTEALLGVAYEDAASGARVEVDLLGLSTVKLGGTVARGDLLTSDANGKAVAIGAVGGTNYNSIGRAMASGVVDDEIEVMLVPSRPQG